MTRIVKLSLLLLALCVGTNSAFAFEYSDGRQTYKLTGYGTVSAINPDFKDAAFLGDWAVRGLATYAVTDDTKIGMTYALDEWAVYQGAYSADAIVFIEDATLGRVEVGLADSVVTKIGLGLPDVGGMRINANPLFFKKIQPDAPIISITPLMSGRYNMRANFITAPTRPLQLAASAGGLTDEYKYNVDFGMKYRQSGGKTKVAANFGVSYIDEVTGLQTDVFGAPVFADWRGQLSAGLNLQYNSWVFGMSTRVIYDENPVGAISDGVFAGAGISYDLLKYSVSATYMMSTTGVWQDMDNYTAHTGMASFRYKYSENVDCWITSGITIGTPFINAGIRAKF